MRIKIDCSACKTAQAMAAKKIPKFGTILRITGYLIVTPSIIGLIIAGSIFFATGQATTEVLPTAKTSAQITGATVGAAVGFGTALFVGFSSLVGGIVGWLLLAKKKVYKCQTCGFILDRA